MRRELPIAVTVKDHAAKTVDVQEQFHAVAILVEDGFDDGGLWLGEGCASVEGVGASVVAGGR